MPQYPIPDWLRGVGNPAETVLAGIRTGAQIAAERARLQQQAQLHQLDSELRQQQLQRDSQLEQQRMEIQKAYQDQQLALKQQELKDYEQEVQVKTQKAAKQAEDLVHFQQDFSDAVSEGDQGMMLQAIMRYPDALAGGGAPMSQAIRQAMDMVKQAPGIPSEVKAIKITNPDTGEVLGFGTPTASGIGVNPLRQTSNEPKALNIQQTLSGLDRLPDMVRAAGKFGIDTNLPIQMIGGSLTNLSRMKKQMQQAGIDNAATGGQQSMPVTLGTDFKKDSLVDNQTYMSPKFGLVRWSKENNQFFPISPKQEPEGSADTQDEIQAPPED